MTIRALLCYRHDVPGYQECVNGEIGAIWDPKDPIKMLIVMIEIDGQLKEIEIPGEDFGMLIDAYSKFGAACLSDWKSEDIVV